MLYVFVYESIGRVPHFRTSDLLAAYWRQQKRSITFTSVDVCTIIEFRMYARGNKVKVTEIPINNNNHKGRLRLAISIGLEERKRRDSSFLFIKTFRQEIWLTQSANKIFLTKFPIFKESVRSVTLNQNFCSNKNGEKFSVGRWLEKKKFQENSFIPSSRQSQ